VITGTFHGNVFAIQNRKRFIQRRLTSAAFSK
jgi:hypothetical protein